MNQPAAEIRWPAAFDLATRPVRVHNQLAMNIPAAQVWAWLIRAPLWPIWYPNSENVRIVSGDPVDLALGSKFRWSTFGIPIRSEVKEVDPEKQIGWDAHGLGVYAYHAWLIRATPEGCHVITEERQHGWAARLQSALMPQRMSSGHQMWLERLRNCAGGGLPG